MNQSLALLLIVSYMTLSFVYSLIEKIGQWQHCTSYYKDHFSRSFLKKHVTLAILFVIFIELLSVGFSLVGVYSFFDSGNSKILLWGLLAFAFTLIVLMTGQRIAQDYSGAMNITVYFMLTVLGLYMLENL